MYKKRHFRCDCGNCKFGKAKVYLDCACSLDDNKDHDNSENAYNQNYFGLFCRCHEEFTSNDEYPMAECIICMEWYHTNHLNPPSEKYKEEELEKGDLICKECLNGTVAFLNPYIGKYKLAYEPREVSKNLYKIIEELNKAEGKIPEHSDKSPITRKRSQPEDTTEINQELKRIKEDPSNQVHEVCKYMEIKDAASHPIEDVFLKPQWRTTLCQCENCKNMYKTRKLTFIFEEEGVNIHNLLDYDSEDLKEDSEEITKKDSKEIIEKDSKEEIKEGTKVKDHEETTIGIYNAIEEMQLNALPTDRQIGRASCRERVYVLV